MSRFMLVGLCLVVFLPLGARGQQWSAEQQEVWQHVETYWSMYANEDVEGFLSYLHEDFSGWTHTNALPRDKEDMARYLPRGFETTETVLHDVNPVGITVHGNIAVVHYYYTRSYVDMSGGEHSDAGRWTEVLMKQGDRWVMITDHGGSDGGT
jgi:ketosteroid isomerase-like protein